MAERRMFAKTIIDSDAFLDMPLSTQALYFHLAMRADDDGFINKPKMIMRMIGASQNELELLLSKRYLLSFDSGVVVIKHWRIHNYIQKDRYKKTMYLEELEKLEIKENKSYTDKDLLSMDTEWIQNGYSMDTECVQNGDTGKVRLGKSKVSIGKINIGENEEKTPTAELSALEEKNIIQFSDSDSELYNSIKTLFEKEQLQNRFKDYGKEGKSIKALIKEAQARSPDAPDIFLHGMIEQFRELRETDKFFSKQPFTPSALNSSGIFDRVLNEAQQQWKAEQEIVTDFEEILF